MCSVSKKFICFFDQHSTVYGTSALCAFFNPRNVNPRIWFQQNKAPLYYGVNVRRFLDTTSEGKCTERRRKMKWFARFPDLTLLDFLS